MSIKLIAHVKKDDNGIFSPPHELGDHLIGTAELCEHFCAKFCDVKIGRIIGLSHDIGKASDAFQRIIREATGFEAHLEGKAPSHVDHSTAAAPHAGTWIETM